MSNEEDSANNSEYDEESFDNESIEEISDVESISEISNSDPSVEDLLQENVTIKSLTGSTDKLSYEEEASDFSSLNSEEDDNAVSELPEKKEHESMKDSQTEIITEKNEHEIDESDSDDCNELEVEISENVKSENIQTDETPSDPIPTEDTKCNDNDQSDQSEIEFNVTSQTPTSFNSDNHAFHMDIIHKPTRSNTSIQNKSRNANRKSLSFSNERMREIERHNQILLQKILTQKPRKENLKSPNMRTSSSAVNRKKQQRQIDLDNQVLKKKIEAISIRRRQHQNLYQ